MSQNVTYHERLPTPPFSFPIFVLDQIMFFGVPVNIDTVVGADFAIHCRTGSVKTLEGNLRWGIQFFNAVLYIAFVWTMEGGTIRRGSTSAPFRENPVRQYKHVYVWIRTHHVWLVETRYFWQQRTAALVHFGTGTTNNNSDLYISEMTIICHWNIDLRIPGNHLVVSNIYYEIILY